MVNVHSRTTRRLIASRIIDTATSAGHHDPLPMPSLDASNRNVFANQQDPKDNPILNTVVPVVAERHNKSNRN